MIWLDKECSSGDFTYKNTSELSAVPTQLSTLCLKINDGFSIPREEKHFICWIGLLFWHPWKPRASFLAIVSTSLAVWRLQTRSQQMALGSCSCSSSCFGSLWQLREALFRNWSFPSPQNGAGGSKSVQVTCDLVTHSSLGAVGFSSELLKIKLLLCFLWEGKSPAFPKCPDMSCGAPSCCSGHQGDDVPGSAQPQVS